MNRSLLKIAKRYSQTSKHQPTIRVLRFIGVTGIALGIFCMIVVLSVMRGFERDFQEAVKRFESSYQVTSKTANQEQLIALLGRLKNEISFEEFIEGELALKSEGGHLAGIKLRGIEKNQFKPERWGTVYPDHSSEILNGLVLGHELAMKEQLYPDFSDEAILVYPFGEVTPSGEVRPIFKKLPITATFDSSSYQYDSVYVLTELKIAQEVLTNIPYRSWSLEPINETKRDYEALLGDIFKNSDFEFQSWKQKNQRLFEVLALEQVGMAVLLSIVLLLACCIIFSLLSLLIRQKQQDMALLRAIGFNHSQVRKLFFWQSLVLGMKGTLIGVLSSVLLVVSLDIWPLRLPPTYYVEFLPVNLNAIHVVWALLLGPVVSLLAAAIPLYEIRKLSLAEELRAE